MAKARAGKLTINFMGKNQIDSDKVRLSYVSKKLLH